MKIGNNLRDLMLKQEETRTLTSRSAVFLGEKYSYNKVKKAKILEIIKQTSELLETRDSHWFRIPKNILNIFSSKK